MDFFLVWLISVVTGAWIYKKFREWQHLPPGPWGLPVLGYLPFLNRHYPHITMTNLSKTYGPIYGIKMGSIYTVVLSDHKLIREAFAKDSIAGRAPLFLTHGIMHGNGIICAEGSLWKDQRKLITSWLKSFGMSKHSVCRDILERRISTGVFELLQNLNKSNEEPVDLSHMLTNSLGNVINDIIFGFKFRPDDRTWNWLRQIQEEGCHEMGVAGVVNFLPFVRFFLPGIRKTMEVLIRGQAQTHRLYASIIARRRKILGFETPKGAEYPPHKNLLSEHPEGHIKCIKYSKHASETEHYFDPETLIPTEGECILDNFLIEQKKRFGNPDDDTAWYMRDEQMYYLLADMFGAGLDTTSVTLAWFLLYTAIHQDVQDMIHKEIKAIYADEDEAVDSSKLPFLMATICETQRIRSIVPVGIPHGCVQETYLADFRIPRGAMVVPLQWAIHMDPQVWEEPETFNPYRFIGDDGQLLKPHEFIPFQTGKRMCPGDELSRMISCSLVARLFRKWRVRLEAEPPSEEEMLGAVGVTLAPPKVMYICEPIN